MNTEPKSILQQNMTVLGVEEFPKPTIEQMVGDALLLLGNTVFMELGPEAAALLHMIMEMKDWESAEMIMRQTMKRPFDAEDAEKIDLYRDWIKKERKARRRLAKAVKTFMLTERGRHG